MDFVSHSNSHYLGAPGLHRQHLSTLLLRMGLISVLFFTLNVQSVFSQSGSPSAPMPIWNVQAVDSPKYFTNMTSRALSYSPAGVPCAAFGGDGLYFSCYNSTTGAWDTITVDNSIGVGEYASLAQRYNPYTGEIRSAITYYDAFNGKLKLAYTNLGVWQMPITVPTPFSLKPAKKIVKGAEPTFEDEILKLTQPWMSILKENDPNIVFDTIGVGKYSSIALDTQGGFNISYYDENDASLNYAYWDGATWSFELVDDYVDIGKGVGLWSSIQMDQFTNVHIAYMDEKYDHLKYAFKNHENGEWTRVTVDSGGNTGANVGSMCSLALNSAGTPYISYLDFSNGNLKVAALVDLRANQWVIDKVDTADYTGWYTSIYVDSSNTAHVSYYNASRGDLKYARGKPGGNWYIATLQDTQGNVGLFTSIAWNAAIGRPMILYYNANNGWLMFTQQYSSTKWYAAQIVASNSHDVGLATSLAVNSAGVPFISYLDNTSGFLKYTRAVGSTFPTSYPFRYTYDGLFSSIKVINIDKPQMSFYDSYNHDLYYARWVGSSWAFQLVDWREDVGQYNSLAIDSHGAPSISYYNATEASLMYAYWDIGLSDWFTTTLDDVGEVGKYTSLALDSANRAYVSYYDETNGDLKLKYQSPFHIWVQQPITVDAGGPLNLDVGMYNSIALDSLGYPHISYYDYVNGDLKYAFWQDPTHSPFPGTSGSWNISTLQSVGDVGRFTSLKIYNPGPLPPDPNNDQSHICYYDYTNKDLMYARYLGGVWDFQTVDSLGDQGLYCSIDLNGLGQPAISYYDNSKGDLKLAISYPLPPALVFIPMISLDNNLSR